MALQPRSEADLVAMVQQALSRKTPLEITGTGTKTGLGRPISTVETIDLSQFSEVSLYEPEELVITAGAGALLADIQSLLDASGQEFAFEPPDLSKLLGTGHRGTLGGMLACNLSGPRRLKAGAVRDHILGVAGVSGRGEAFKAGGRVVKNVTGYDLAKLMAGSYGTLAALTSVTFKALPRAESEETLVLEGLDDEAAIAAMSLAMQSPCEVSGAAHLPRGLAGEVARTFLRLEGIQPSIAYRRDKLVKLVAAGTRHHLLDAADSRKTWAALRDVHPLTDSSERIVWRLSVPPAGAARVTASLAQQLDMRWFYDWAGGLIWLDMPPSQDASAKIIRAALPSGHATLIRAADAIRTSVQVMQPQPPALAALARRVKAAFDPTGIFNPGRMQVEN
ncbi:glycolate oxidase subunit GlcE [Taklimakanibacter lacteus]|uniref:glycolate oxidase subunit GlcE n=1 Tax=Taklimakanibacter lacteus TaxID=2268456 RepID=UPI000E666D14